MLAFVDDTVFIVIGKDFHETHRTLQDMLNRPGGSFEWSKDHNSCFEPSKFALLDFSMNSTKECPPMNIKGAVISPGWTHCFLGVLVDNALCWHAHMTYTIGKGTAYVLQLRCLSLISKGIPLSLMKQLYMSVALPKMLYAVDLWFKPIYNGDSDTAQRGSIGTTKRMSSIQSPSKKLHYVISIAPTRKTAIQLHNKSNANTQVYCNGSRENEKIGAAAVLYTRGKSSCILHYHLGTASKHTVYEAEAVGLTLAAHLLCTGSNIELPIAIFVDNQAVIKSGEVFIMKSGHYLTDHFCRSMKSLRKKFVILCDK
ncbi:hypothetical protein PAXRUDRAFT_158079 [Paxillus rubicundulus Ve08.2h10]|uniref:Reverse transcriptase domain-containing protein n=1 Tax=Paxillus rubicundulus Ve08.2h10 TaxID=930991 RepID=A0A0D0CD40_9AGAM|nr:hypothetical protein PAXRUDRAFT_158079 [Paxillus rubicundulus Ve08.2h10]